MTTKNWLIITIIFVFSVTVYLMTSPGNTAFNHFTLLADSFLHGKIYIEGNMPWLEKIPIDENKFYVANPPMPALFSMFPVLIFGKDLPQQYIAHVTAGLIIVLTFLISLKIKNNLKLAIWSAVFIGFGTINWYLATVGSTWYLAHLVSQMFLSLSILLLLKNKNPFLIGLFLGFSYLSRIPTILTLPFFLLNLHKPSFKKTILLLLGILPSLIANALYNYLRFGAVWDIGYTLIPGVTTEPWYQRGILHPSYIGNHLKIILATIPKLSDVLNFYKPSIFGYAIWFTTPVFILSLFNKIREKLVWSTWLSIFLISLLIFSHGSTGFSQFGYRFAADFYPLLALLTIKATSSQNGPKWYHWLLLAIGIFVNFWGVYTLNLTK